MGLSIGQAKQQFAAIIECLHREPSLLSQFAVWLDLKLSEYKLQGGMRLDFHEVVSHPDWMQGVKCRCLQSVTTKMQSLAQSGGFGNSAWMFPLMDGANPAEKHPRYQEAFSESPAARDNGCEPENTEVVPTLDRNLDVSSIEHEKSNSSFPDDRHIFNSPSIGFSAEQSRKSDQSASASTFLSNLAMAASYDQQKDTGESAGMSLPVRPVGPEVRTGSLENNNGGGSVNMSYDMSYDMGDSRSGDECNDSNDLIDEDDEVEEEYDEEDDDSLPKIISVTSVGPDSSICYPKGFRSNKKGKNALRIRAMSNHAKKMRIVRNYSREFKLRVIGHCLKHGTKSAMLTFDVPKTNCQRWTARVAKSSPDCGIPDTTGLESEMTRAEERLATWVRDTHYETGPPTVLALQSMASTIFKHVHPDFEPAYVWILNYLARYKLAKMIDIPCDFDDTCPVTTEDLGDLC